MGLPIPMDNSDFSLIVIVGQSLDSNVRYQVVY